MAKNKFNPDYFLYENNKSISQSIKDKISQELGVDIVTINSTLVSAQNRERIYCCNWHIEQPADRNISLGDIVENNDNRVVGVGYRGRLRDGKWAKQYEKRKDNKANALTTAITDSMLGEVVNSDKVSDLEIRKFTPIEAERLQTLPDNYTRAVSNSRRYKCIGNGWTAEVIIHILNGALKNVPRNEKLLVLSMYDGIATGRYCLDKMGFTNVEYHAYEIDKYAMAIAKDNYPDIIYHGDAFGIRDDDWSLYGA